MSELQSFVGGVPGRLATAFAVLLAAGCQFGAGIDDPAPPPPVPTADHGTGNVRAYGLDATPIGIAQRLDDAADMAPDSGEDQFIGLSLNGRSLYRSQFHGSALLVTYWARDCLACRMGMNRLRSLYSEYRLRGLEIVAVNSRESRQAVKAYLTGLDRAYPYTIAVAPGSVPQRLGAMRIYDLEGRLAADYPDAAGVAQDGLRRELDRILPVIKSGR